MKFLSEDCGRIIQFCLWKKNIIFHIVYTIVHILKVIFNTEFSNNLVIYCLAQISVTILIFFFNISVTCEINAFHYKRKIYYLLRSEGIFAFWFQATNCIWHDEEMMPSRGRSNLSIRPACKNDFKNQLTEAFCSETLSLIFC